MKKTIAIVLMTLAAPATAHAWIPCSPIGSTMADMEMCQHQNELEERIEQQQKRLKELEDRQQARIEDLRREQEEREQAEVNAWRYAQTLKALERNASGR